MNKCRLDLQLLAATEEFDRNCRIAGTRWSHNQQDYTIDQDDLSPYVYYHWNLVQAYQYPHFAVSQLLKDHMPLVARILEMNKVKPGDIILRGIKYLENRPFGGHHDFDYATIVLGSTSKDGHVNSKASGHIFMGLQAELIHDQEPTYHKFNPCSLDYSFVIFINAHYSQPCKEYGTIGGFLNHVYYSKK